MLVMSCQANPYQRLILLPDLRTDRPEREDGLQTWHEVFGPGDANPAVLRTTCGTVTNPGSPSESVGQKTGFNPCLKDGGCILIDFDLSSLLRTAVRSIF